MLKVRGMILHLMTIKEDGHNVLDAQFPAAISAILYRMRLEMRHPTDFQYGSTGTLYPGKMVHRVFFPVQMLKLNIHHWCSNLEQVWIS